MPPATCADCDLDRVRGRNLWSIKSPKAGYQSIAVGLIHSYLNPAHEQMVRDVIEAERMPDVDGVPVVQKCRRRCANMNASTPLLRTPTSSR